jgi:hypothetical protein
MKINPKWSTILLIVVCTLPQIKAQNTILVAKLNAEKEIHFLSDSLNQTTAYFLNDGSTVSNAKVEMQTGNYFIVASKSRGKSSASVAINLELKGNQLFLHSGSCIHECQSTSNTPCKPMVYVECISMSCSEPDACQGEVIMINRLKPNLNFFSATEKIE